MARSVHACTVKNLPREQTDGLVLQALSEKVFTLKRVSLMLNELLRHQRQAKTAEDARLITMKTELDRATTGLDRLYKTVEEGALSNGTRTPSRRSARGAQGALHRSELVVRVSHRRLADAIGFMEKRKLGEVPSFVNDWRARRDSNPRPLASEANTLIR